MFNKAERARREAARDYHQRSYNVVRARLPETSNYAVAYELTDRARFHRKQAELWAKSVRDFDRAAINKAKLMRRVG